MGEERNLRTILHAPSVSPVLARFGVGLDDVIDEPRRASLMSAASAMPDTANDGLDEARTYLAADWLIRVWTPAWLELAKLPRDAMRLRTLHRIVDASMLRASLPALRSARDAARDAARGAAWGAARGAAWGAAWGAARDAAWEAARVAARDAAWGAAWDALRPTVEQLQESAVELFSAMVKPGAA